MYLGELDVVHIGPSSGTASENQKKYLGRTSGKSAQEEGTGAIDHIAFRATGLRAMIDLLQEERIAFSRRRANGQALFQLFFYDPNGIKIELNYDAAEPTASRPRSWRPTLLGAEEQRREAGDAGGQRVALEDPGLAAREDAHRDVGARHHALRDRRVDPAQPLRDGGRRPS
jgi:hypothetical protein